MSTETGLPLRWSASENVTWKTGIPGEGWSSPIVWGERVFVTTATNEGRTLRLLCLDRTTGKVLWNREVLTQSLSRKEGKNSFATPTPVTDGQRVYVVAFNGNLAAVNLDGSIAWTHREVDFSSRHGLGVSPILERGMVIVPFDGSGREPNEGLGWHEPWDKAFVLAVDAKTGKTRWKSPRGMSRIAHVTPNVLRGPEGDQLVSGAGDVIQGFDLESGKLLWTFRSEGEGVVPSIVLGEGLVFTASGFGKPTIRAVRTGGQGDITATNLAWEYAKVVPAMPSFLYAKPYLFTINEKGVAMCLKADRGDVVWQERVGGNHSASPLWAEGRIYFLAEDGQATVIEAGPEFKVLARNAIGEKCQASMAASEKQFFLRTEKNLYCIGPRAQP